ncbi:MAG: response regulator transcription factor [Chloroflexi bacterium]|nr:response regulator transcription factor [Chloroflexota bacterium]
MSRVVILSSRSLFVEGIASRLKQQMALELLTVDSRQDDALAQVIAARPTAVILDATDPDVTRHCPLSKLLSAMPSLKVIRLDPQQEQVQVVSSEQRPVGEVRDLIEVIEPSQWQ